MFLLLSCLRFVYPLSVNPWVLQPDLKPPWLWQSSGPTYGHFYCFESFWFIFVLHWLWDFLYVQISIWKLLYMMYMARNRDIVSFFCILQNSHTMFFFNNRNEMKIKLRRCTWMYTGQRWEMNGLNIKLIPSTLQPYSSYNRLPRMKGLRNCIILFQTGLRTLFYALIVFLIAECAVH